MNWPKNALMVTPQGFDIQYSINPHMLDENGKLHQVNRARAQEQWQKLRDTFQKIGLEVQTIEGPQGLPDMVFCANPFFPFVRNGKTQFVMSQMNSSFRQNEVALIKAWALQNNVETYELPENTGFEGMGDALWNYETGELFGGYGFRTAAAAYEALEKIIEAPIYRLQLVDDRFYHLDTCLAILNHDTALAVREAFTPAGFELLRAKFPNLHCVSISEAMNSFAANACSVDGHNVVIDCHARETISFLKQSGFQVHGVDTSEFRKAGGSVFCMKMLF